MSQPGAKHYQQMNVQTKLADASPHKLIAMMFDGLLARLAMSKGFIDRGDFEGKSKCLGSAITILGGLQNSLDLKRGGDVAANLDRLYMYMTRRLFAAGVANDNGIIEEVCGLIRTVKEGWDGIKDEVA
jgi:flagellar protein FliS